VTHFLVDMGNAGKWSDKELKQITAFIDQVVSQQSLKAGEEAEVELTWVPSAGSKTG
jgi:hypothetical protein